MTKAEMQERIDELEAQLAEGPKVKPGVPHIVMAALKEISRKGDRMSANLADRALRDVL